MRLSWRRAGIVVQAFFLGNVLAMTGVIGILYQDSVTRVCNACPLDDRQKVGLALGWIAIGVATIWLVRSGLRASRREDSAST